MQKVVAILAVIFFCCSCAVSRKKTIRNKSYNEKEGALVFKKIEDQNISSNSFFIERAEFSIKTEGVERSGLGTIKFKKPDRFLISIKSKTGIEAARIYITTDSVKVNDRINKKLYYGSVTDIKKKYGFTDALVPVILGDFINESIIDKDTIKCHNGEFKFDGIIKGRSINYVIDCVFGKSIITIPETGFEDHTIEINYSEFFLVNNINIPGKIEISDKLDKLSIEISIKKITFPWEGEIDFMPGKQYEKIHLL